MTVSFALLAGTLIMSLAGPRLLRAIALRHDPQVSLVAWLTLVYTGLGSILLAVIVMFMPGHGPAHLLMRALHECWHHATPSDLPWYVRLFAIATSLLVIIGGYRVVSALVRQTRARRKVYRRQLETLRIVARKEAGRYPTMWLDHDVPIAYSVPGKPAIVVATKGLRDHLPAGAVQAVLAHEQAHIRWRHHRLVGIAEALAAALPKLRFARESPQFVRTMVELAADRCAASRHGCASVRSALHAMSDAQLPKHALGMAKDSVAVRLDRLEGAEPHCTPTSRRFLAGITGLVTTAASLSVSATLLVISAGAICPFLLPN